MSREKSGKHKNLMHHRADKNVPLDESGTNKSNEKRRFNRESPFSFAAQSRSYFFADFGISMDSDTFAGVL